MIPSLQDIITGFDATGQPSIEGSDLTQAVSGAVVYTDKGLIMNSTDVNGVAQVPNPTVGNNGKWQNYYWRRIVTNSIGTSIGVVSYQWNPTKAFDAILLYWDQIATVASIGSVTLGNGRILQRVEQVDTNNGPALLHGDILGAGNSQPPQIATGKQIGGLSVNFTPLSSLSTIIVEVYAPFTVNPNGVAGATSVTGNLAMSLFNSAVGSAAVATSSEGFLTLAGAGTSNVLTKSVYLKHVYQNNSTAQVGFTVRAGWWIDWATGAGGTAVAYYNTDYRNPIAGGFLGGQNGKISITEYL